MSYYIDSEDIDAVPFIDFDDDAGLTVDLESYTVTDGLYSFVLLLVSSKTIEYNIEITIESDNTAPWFLDTAGSDLQATYKQYGLTRTFVLPEIFDWDGDEVDIIVDVDKCCTSWLTLSEDETEINLDLDS